MFILSIHIGYVHVSLHAYFLLYISFWDIWDTQNVQHAHFSD